MVDADPDQLVSGSVSVRKLDSGLVASLGRYVQGGCALRSVLRVTIVEPGASTDDGLPSIWGRYRILDDGLRFIPHFPFERGLSHRARFDPRPLGRSERSDVQTLEFSLPQEQGGLPTRVERIFPSADSLPENLLRFYVCFSNPMQRGRAQTEISLLDPDGEPASDALYRAPIELWDRSMRVLTILLDPGRLKRGVGPNRELGPPLKAGQIYTLAVGAGMTDLSGRQLGDIVRKRFCATGPVREPIDVKQWKIERPETNSRQPLVLMFPRPLDRVLLSHKIGIASRSGQSVDGEIAIDRCERRWSFTPASPWAADSYRVDIAQSLEDVCGNDMMAAFDRPLRSGSGRGYEVSGHSIPFRPI
jgi:hypothetical protein